MLDRMGWVRRRHARQEPPQRLRIDPAAAWSGPRERILVLERHSPKEPPVEADEARGLANRRPTCEPRGLGKNFVRIFCEKCQWARG
jgi:hypothetical protein